MDHFVIITGCSGGGKSTLLAELRRRGHPVIEEAGRRVVEAEMRRGGHALPWHDTQAFLRRAIMVAERDHAGAPHDREQWVPRKTSARPPLEQFQCHEPCRR